MKVGIMQPYFFPYIGYFSLINKVDKFYILEDVQFMRHGWIERNRIISRPEGWQYISVPLVKHHQSTVIKDIRIKNDVAWKSKIVAQLNVYKKAPYYNIVIDMINSVLCYEYQGITELNTACLKAVLNYIGISTEIIVFDSSQIVIDKVNAADEWALNICKAIKGVTEYWNPEGGTDFFDRNKYTSSGIKLVFNKMKLKEYNQFDRTFEAGLSIIDIMMFNSVNQIKELLNECEQF